jgi:RHS repeat-associated protein
MDEIRYYDYDPFGNLLTFEGASNRLSWIGKERDKESSLGDHGVRKYDPEIGRFTMVDRLFEKYPGWTPYQYSLNNSVKVDIPVFII